MLQISVFFGTKRPLHIILSIHPSILSSIRYDSSIYRLLEHLSIAKKKKKHDLIKAFDNAISGQKVDYKFFFQK